ncbi:MAG: GDP-mannose 4,6-dehydratase [Methanosarcina sp.]|uniref:GDP-mannose 4,6-dehydratase n=1 Tax=Methanosarcina sp. TaxID=2213 RepID=UPI002617C283|nr:GDP-mannose 4,6-dehydratase [Methanosarcina sp.]MDD3245393.1 GDP-mannose 4,6-dehydratase [Methanosarcina sp.]MDD4247592.1 GDP-mannose 4,6-dehydratase [Methanosarcina sp.]
MTKVALITGINGQDGKYLSKFLINRGYVVHGIRRGTPQSNFKNENDIHLHYSDLTDYADLIRIIQEVQPDEIYNLAAQSNVKISFEKPEYTTLTNALAPLKILEIIRTLGLEKKTRFFQASTGELFGNSGEIPQKESTPFYPKSPYAVSKLYAYWICVNYREAYDIFACNGILFNHESPIRPENFVTRKITKAASRIKKGLQEKLYLGNLNAKRDWGFAGDYVEAMWLMLQQDKPDDYIIATGKAHSVREFVEFAFREVGIEIEWEGEGLDEVGKNASNGRILVEVDPAFYRPVEANLLVGNPSKARKILGWEPKVTFEELVKMMTRNDMNLL